MSAPVDPGRVGVVVLNWRRAQDTIACLQSLANLEQPPGTIQVVDNASGDDSVARISRAFPRLAITVNPFNQGFGAGQNAVIQQLLDADYDWVWLLNNDARVEPQTLTKLLATAARSERTGVVGASIRDLEPPHRLQACGGGRIQWWRGRSYHVRQMEAKIDYVTGACMLLSATALRRAGLFDPGYFLYWEDADLNMRIRRAGYEIDVAEKALVYHAISSSTRAESPGKDFMLNASAVRFFRTHGPLGGWPAICIGVASRIVKRLATGRWAAAGAVWAGFRDGLSRYRNPAAP